MDIKHDKHIFRIFELLWSGDVKKIPYECCHFNKGKELIMIYIGHSVQKVQR